MNFPRDDVPYQNKCIACAVIPNRNMYLSKNGLSPLKAITTFCKTPPSNCIGPTSKHGSPFALL